MTVTWVVSRRSSASWTGSCIGMVFEGVCGVSAYLVFLLPASFSAAKSFW